MKKIYFDHSATTPVDKEVLKNMLPYFEEIYGNPSSIHSFGQEAIAGVDEARQNLANFLNCETSEVIFTSGATESDNLAIRGFIEALKKKKESKLHIITSKIEHDAVLEPCKLLEKDGVEVSYLNINNKGVVNVDDLQSLIKENTVLVSVMYVNSEVGSVQPIREIGKMIEKINETRIKDWNNTRVSERGAKPQKIYFHTDATQALNFFDCNTKYLHVDMLSLSAHKIYGPKGAGALFVKNDTPLTALQFGGHHEGNKRSGTLNVPGIVGLGAAIKLLTQENIENNNKKIASLRDYLVQGIQSNIPEAILNTDTINGSPSHAHFSFLGVEGESILISLDFEGIAVSTGSACASGSLEPSHVLLSMGIEKEVAHNSIRFTLGKNNTKEEIDYLIEKMPPIIERLRKMNPIYKK